jgi:transposase
MWRSRAYGNRNCNFVQMAEKEGRKWKSRVGKNGSFIRKIDPEVLKEYVEKHTDHTITEMKQDVGFGISSIWYGLKQLKIPFKKSRYIESAIKMIGINSFVKSKNYTALAFHI